jgi:hypothetical protein
MKDKAVLVMAVGLFLAAIWAAVMLTWMEVAILWAAAVVCLSLATWDIWSDK